MTQKEILKLAYKGASDIWVRRYKVLGRDPNNSIFIAKERKAWNDFEEIRKMVLSMENEEVSK